ncbi:hypothetical protein KSP40_PGU000721 [Platanthera guangdongensis]|uniref:Uncharacterized protein n=1 Tax=Platanthera guangdongensis TaxID=2320717 RepID=A0ABR2LN12_9ASPA
MDILKGTDLFLCFRELKLSASYFKALFVWAFRCSILGKRLRKEGKQINLRWRLLRFHPPALRNAPKSLVWSSHLPPPWLKMRSFKVEHYSKLSEDLKQKEGVKDLVQISIHALALVGELGLGDQPQQLFERSLQDTHSPHIDKKNHLLKTKKNPADELLLIEKVLILENRVLLKNCLGETEVSEKCCKCLFVFLVVQNGMHQISMTGDSCTICEVLDKNNLKNSYNIDDSAEISTNYSFHYFNTHMASTFTDHSPHNYGSVRTSFTDACRPSFPRPLELKQAAARFTCGETTSRRLNSQTAAKPPENTARQRPLLKNPTSAPDRHCSIRKRKEMPHEIEHLEEAISSINSAIKGSLMASTISSLWMIFLILSSVGFLPHLVFGRGGFSVELIHRDSPKSPHYPRSTAFARLFSCI